MNPIFGIDPAVQQELENVEQKMSVLGNINLLPNTVTVTFTWYCSIYVDTYY